ncbi:MAG: PhoH family protein [candidate division WOR-3 bacterium]|nr:PhoH family protein [candidate division WOR-3 bacterium]MDW7987875.1 PhoH family protein [candidate division WOR-3 bacterium]
MSDYKNKIGRFSISLQGIDPVALLGLADENLRIITQNFQSQIVVRGDRIRITGPQSELADIRELFTVLIDAIKRDETITPSRIKKEINNIIGGKRQTSLQEKKEAVQEGTIYTPKKIIVPKSDNQKQYLLAIDRYDIVIAIGPAGTGKTYLAVAKAVEALTSGKISRIVLTRPAVEAGEQLGFLPGNFKEKVDPYLRPLYDALYDMMSLDRIKRLIDEQVLEVAPLAYMRGRTLSDAYIILDEAQNTTSAQMKMFLTRLGWNSKSIVTGDITQIDLDRKQSSGLVEIQYKLRNIEDIKFIYFDDRDVVRPPLVSKIIRAYAENQ